VNVGILEEMAELDFKTPFDELTELRTLLTTQEIAELTGLRRETISRARPDSRFQRRTEKALADLYAVVTRMRSLTGDDIGQLAAVLRRPQDDLGGRSIAALLRGGQVDAVLKSLSPAASTDLEALANFRLDPDVEAQLEPWKEPTEEQMMRAAAIESDQVSDLLAGDPELASRLGAIEAALLAHFGPGTRVERRIISEYDDPEGSDELYLRVHTDLSFDEEIDGLGALLERKRDLLRPVRSRLTIGFL
jgi:hypothetical protein